jgi:hypothetical protein
MPDSPTGRANPVVDPGEPPLPTDEPRDGTDDDVQSHDPYQPL